MDCIYIVPLSKALYNLGLLITHSHTHSHTNGDWLPCKCRTRAGRTLNWSYARPPLKTIFCKQWSRSSQEMHWPLILGHGRNMLECAMPQKGAGQWGTAIHWTPVVLPQGNFGFLAMDGLEADMVMICWWMHLGTRCIYSWYHQCITIVLG